MQQPKLRQLIQPVAEHELPANLVKKVEKAKTQLVMMHPFWATLLLNCKLIPTRDHQTAATDGMDICYNVDFFANLPWETIQFILAHEVSHKMWLHVLRLNERDPQLWNAAGDYLINDTLVESGLPMPMMDEQQLAQYNATLAAQGKPPVSSKEFGLLDQARYNDSMTTDEIYKLLYKEKEEQEKNQPQSGQSGAGDPADNNGDESADSPNGNDHLLQPGQLSGRQLSEAEVRELRDEVKAQVAKAATIAKQAGKLPGALAKLVDAALKPIVDWKKQLREFVTAKAYDQRSWKRPRKHTMAHGLYMPVQDGVAVGPLVIAFDTSGSIYHHQGALDRFCSEINAIVNDLSPERVDVIYFDTQVRGHDEFHQGEPVEFKLRGGGGTEFSCIAQWVNQNTHDASAVIIFTDLYGSCSAELPYCDAMWAVYDNREPTVPYGRYISVNED